MQEERPNFSDTLKVGNNCVIDKICEDKNITSILKNVFNENDKTYKLILDLASYFVISGNSTIQHFDGYCWNHAILSNKSYSDSTI